MTTTDPEPYQPRDGEAGHVTIRGTYRAATGTTPASFELDAAMMDHDGDQTWIAVEEWLGKHTRGLIGFRPLPLPVPLGSMILAEFGRERPALLVLLQTDNVPAWFISGAMPYQRIAVEDIQIGWVEIGPDTLRPVRATS